MPIIIQNGQLQTTYIGQTQTLLLSDIEYIEANEWLCKIHTANREILCAARLGKLCAQLSEYGFFRCHKGFAVNIHKVKNHNARTITLTSGKTIPVGRVYKSQFFTSG